MAMTDEQVREYVAERGARCPFCATKGTVEESNWVSGPKGATEEADCSTCGARWFNIYSRADEELDIYKLTGLDPVTEADDETEA